MPSFLSVNNLDVQVASCTKRTVEAGGARRYPGTWRDQRQGLKREWDVETCPMSEDDAEALSHWLLGRGDHWSFDVRAYSDGGVGPNTASTSAFGIVTGVTKFSEPLTSFVLVGSAGQTASFSIPLDGPDQSYTVSRWVWNGTDVGYGLWRHYVNRYDASTGVTTAYLDTAVMPAISNFTITAASNVLTYLQRARNNAHGADVAIWIEDLVMVPYAMTTAQIAAIYNSAATQPFGRCPLVRITGTILDEAGPVEVEVTLAGQARLQAGDTGGVWSQSMRSLKFTMREV